MRARAVRQYVRAVSSPTWESAHNLNERGKEKKNHTTKPVCRCQPGTAPQPCTAAHGSGTVTQRPHAALGAAAGQRRAGRTCRRNRARGQPQTFIVPSPLAALLFLPPSQAFFICFLHFSPAFLSVLSCLPPPCFLYALSS